VAQRALEGWKRSKTFAESTEKRLEHARLDVFQEVLDGEQGVNLAGVEPDTGQFIPWSGVGRRGEPVSSTFTVPFNGRVEVAPQVFEIAFEGGDGDANLFQKTVHWHAAIGSQEFVDMVKALGLIHFMPVMATSCRCVYLDLRPHKPIRTSHARACGRPVIAGSAVNLHFQH
jgi:hypothetical protein